MSRPPKFVDELHALKILSLYRKAKRKNPEVGFDEFFTEHGMREMKRYLPPMLDLLRDRYGFQFVRLCRKKSGRSDLVAEADAVLDRFDAAFDRFLADDRRQDADRPTRVGAWGAVLDSCLAPAVAKFNRAGQPVPVLASDLRSFPYAMRKLVGFRVDAVLSPHDADEKRAVFTNLVEFHPGGAGVHLLLVSRTGGERPRLFPAGLPSQWGRVAPRPEPKRGDLVIPSPLAALELVRDGFGAAVVVGLPLVRRRAVEIGLTTEPIDFVPELRLGVYTRYPRDTMLPAGRWAKVQDVLAACTTD